MTVVLCENKVLRKKVRKSSESQNKISEVINRATWSTAVLAIALPATSA